MAKVRDKDIIHLDGTLYLVKADLIKISDGAGDDGKYVNPRRTFVKGRLMGRGFSKEEMDELKESIRTEGLQHALSVWSGTNLGEQKLILIGGERRKLCIDALKKQNAMCKDYSTGKEVPAQELYSHIPCNVYIGISLKEAYKLGFSTNEQSVGIGEGATVALVRTWRQQNWSDAEICYATNKSITWLHDTDNLVGLDDKTFGALLQGDVNRTVALRLSKINSIPQRHKRLQLSMELAAKRLAAMQEQEKAAIEQADEQVEVAKAAVADAQFLDDPEAEQKAIARTERAEGKKSRRITQASKLSERRIRVSAKDLNRAGEDFDDDNSALSMAKIKKHHIAELDDIIEEKTHTDKALLLKHWWETGVLGGNRDLREVFDLFDENN